jgi:hypothetical protein
MSDARDPFEPLLAQQRYEAKEASAWWACWVWFISGAFLYLRSGGFAALFSVSAVIFIGLGMFASSLFIGGAFYLAGRVVLKLSMIWRRWPSGTEVAVLRSIGWILFVGEIVGTFSAARWAFYRFIG